MSKYSVTLLLGGEERTLEYTLDAWERLQDLLPDGDLSKVDELPLIRMLPLVIQAGLDPDELPADFTKKTLSRWLMDADPEKLTACIEAWKYSGGFLTGVLQGLAKTAEAVAPASQRKGKGKQSA